MLGFARPGIQNVHVLKALLLFFALFGVAIQAHSQDHESNDPLWPLEKSYFSKMTTVQAEYRQELAAFLSKSTRVEIYLLDFEIENTDSGFLFWENRLPEDKFPIIPFGAQSSILQTKILSEEEQQGFLPILQKTVAPPGDPGGGALCHYPIHGVRCYLEDAIIFQSSFCWYCFNFSMSYPNGAILTQITPEIETALNELLPIPAAELERFQEKYPPPTSD